MISPEQITFMEHNRPHYDTLIRAQFLTNIGYDIKQGMLDLAREFAPGYMVNLWCPPCVCELVKYAYTQFDKWKLENVKAETFPLQEPEIESIPVEVEKVKRKYERKAK